MDWLVQTLLLSAVFNLVFCEDPWIEVGKKIIARSNELFSGSNLTDVELEEFSSSPVDFEDGRVGKLDTLEFMGLPVYSTNPKEYGTTYDFFVRIGMKKLTLKYRYVMPLPLIYRKGGFSIDVGKNLFYAGALVFVGKDGNCTATLTKAYAYKLEDYEVKIDPNDIGISFIREFYEHILNKIIHNRVPSLVDHAIQRKIHNEAFKEEFNNIVCSEMNRSGSDTEQNEVR